MAKAKTNRLAAALDDLDEPQAVQSGAAASEPPARAKASTKQAVGEGRRDREGKVLLSAWVEPHIRTSLRMIALEESTTAQALIEEAVDMLLKKKGKLV